MGRDFVTPDDIRDIATPALRHRIALAPELQIEGQDPDQVLHALLAKVEAPRPRVCCAPSPAIASASSCSRMGVADRSRSPAPDAVTTKTTEKRGEEEG